MLTILLASTPSLAATLTVGSSGTYSSIQSAILDVPLPPPTCHVVPGRALSARAADRETGADLNWAYIKGDLSRLTHLGQRIARLAEQRIARTAGDDRKPRHTGTDKRAAIRAVLLCVQGFAPKSDDYMIFARSWAFLASNSSLESAPASCSA